MDEHEFKARVSTAAEIYSFDANKVIELLTPHNEILNWIKKTKRSAVTYTKFKNHIEFTKDTFLEMNGYIKNDGYKKLAKRCDLLLDQLEKNRRGDKVHPMIKRFFHSKFKDNLPSKVNVLSIAVDNIFWYFVNSENNLQNATYAKDIICDIFYIRKFNTSLKYTSIKILTEKQNNIKLISKRKNHKKQTYEA